MCVSVCCVSVGSAIPLAFAEYAGMVHGDAIGCDSATRAPWLLSSEADRPHAVGVQAPVDRWRAMAARCVGDRMKPRIDMRTVGPRTLNTMACGTVQVRRMEKVAYACVGRSWSCNARACVRPRRASCERRAERNAARGRREECARVRHSTVRLMSVTVPCVCLEVYLTEDDIYQQTLDLCSIV